MRERALITILAWACAYRLPDLSAILLRRRSGSSLLIPRNNVATVGVWIAPAGIRQLRPLIVEQVQRLRRLR